MSSLMQSNLGQRVVVALAGIPLLIWINIQGGLYFLAMVLVLSLMATWEFRQLAVHLARPLSLPLFLLLTTFLQLNVFFRFFDNWNALLAVVMTLFVIEIWRHEGSQFLNIGSTLVSLLYVNLTFGSLLRLRLEAPSGELLVLLMFLCVWAADIFAYFGGRGLGGKFFKRKLFPRISPKKTWEGYLSGIAGSAVVAWVCYSFMPGFGDERLLVTGLVIGIVGPVGDLMESMFKRDAGVKDSSGIIPGHGGILDRFDTIMFTAPLIWLLVSYG